MKWKVSLGSLFAAMSGLGAFVGLLNDFQGAASMLGKVFEIIQALLPIIALGGITWCSLWALYFLGQMINKFLPRTKFKMLNDEIKHCKDLAWQHIDSWSYPNNKNAVSALATLELKLERLSIPFPNVDTSQDEYIHQWAIFLIVISEASESSDLRSARQAIEKLSDRSDNLYKA